MTARRDIILVLNSGSSSLKHAAYDLAGNDEANSAFHADLPDISRTLPIPRELRKSGIRRYGFHGLSFESVIHQLGIGLPERAVIAHLGNGASVTAVREGRSIDTSMGLTPSGGIIMGTRSGDIDPGVLIHLMTADGSSPSDLEEVIDQRSGQLGVSGVSSDMRQLHLEPARSDADLAVRRFCRSAAKQMQACSLRWAAQISWCSPAASVNTMPPCAGRSAPISPGRASRLKSTWLRRTVTVAPSHFLRSKRTCSPNMFGPSLPEQSSAHRSWARRSTMTLRPSRVRRCCSTSSMNQIDDAAVQ